MIPLNPEESAETRGEKKDTIPQTDETESNSIENRRRWRRWVLFALLAIPVLYVAVGLSLRFLITGGRTRVRNIAAVELKDSLDNTLSEAEAQLFINILNLHGDLTGFPSDNTSVTASSPMPTNTVATEYRLTFVQQFNDAHGRSYRFLLRRYTSESDLAIISIQESTDGITWLPSKIPIPSKAAQERASQLARRMFEGASEMLTETIQNKLLPADK